MSISFTSFYKTRVISNAFKKSGSEVAVLPVSLNLISINSDFSEKNIKKPVISYIRIQITETNCSLIRLFKYKNPQF